MKIDGIPVKDALKSLNVRITRRDIQLANTKDPNHCAAARAICNNAGADAARVHVGRTYVKFGNQWTRYVTPKALRTEIIAFDRGGKFEAGTYRLEKVPPTQVAAARKARKVAAKRSSHNGKGPKKRRPHIVKGIRGRGNVGAMYDTVV